MGVVGFSTDLARDTVSSLVIALLTPSFMLLVTTLFLVRTGSVK